MTRLVKVTVVWAVVVSLQYIGGWKSHPAYVAVIAEGIRAALAADAADAPNKTFPAATRIRDYHTLRLFLQQPGGTLRAETEAQAGCRFMHYEPLDTDHDGVADSYRLLLAVFDIPARELPTVRVTPAGLERLSP